MRNRPANSRRVNTSVLAYALRSFGTGEVLVSNDDEISILNSNGNDYPPEDTLGDQWLRGSGFDLKGTSTASATHGAGWYERVSQLAYKLYLRRGQVPGHDLDDWFTAERILLLQLPHHGGEGGDTYDGKST
jgi:hypothetical protein